jgi:hypothetical protein
MKREALRGDQSPVKSRLIQKDHTSAIVTELPKLTRVNALVRMIRHRLR